MTYDPQIHHRRSIRLRGYDYSRAGLYFVTVCAHGKEDLFGQMVEGEMKPNDYGEAVRLFWNDLPRHYPHARLDSFVVMPNHAHGVIEIVGAGLKPAPTARASLGLPEIIRRFKTYSSRRINEMRGTPGRPVWQRNYYEHIIRGQHELNVIREYVATNPLRGATDPENVLR